MQILDVNVILTLFLVAAAGWFINSSLPGSSGMKRVTNVALGLIVIGILLWLVNTYVPMAGSIRAILNIVVFVAVCIKVLQIFGFWGEVVRAWDGVVHRSRVDPSR